MVYKEKQIFILIFIILLVSYSYFFHFIGRESWNATSRLALTYSLAERGTFRIDPYQTETGDKVYYRGHYYSDKAPGASLIAVPFYLILKWMGVVSEKFMRYGLTLLVIGLPSALGALFFYRLTGLLQGYSLRQRTLVTLSYGLGTLAFPFSTIFYGHQLAAVLAVSSFYLLLQMKVRRNPGGWILGSSGFLAGLAFLSDFPAGIILVLLFLYGLIIMEDRKRILFWLAGAALPIFFLGWYNYHCFGSPAAFSYSLHNTYSHSGGFLGINWPRLNALWGITFSPYRGLFYQSPVLLLFLPGIYLWWRRKNNRPEIYLALLIVLGFFFFNAGYDYWDGVGSVGARFLIPALPFLCLALLEASRRWPGPLQALGLLSLIIMLVVTATEPRAEWNVKSPIFYFNFFLFSQGYLSDNLGMTAGLGGISSLIPLAAFLAIIMGVIIKPMTSGIRPPDLSRRVLGSVGIAGIAVLWLVLAGWERPVLREYDKAESLFRYFRSQGEIQWDPITDHYRAAISADPGFLNPYLRLAQIARARGRPRAAVRYYRQLLEWTPERNGLRQEIASIYRDLGELDRAEKELLQALQTAPRDASVRNQLAEIYWNSSRPQKAIEQLEESLKINPEDRRVRDQLRTIRSLEEPD